MKTPSMLLASATLVVCGLFAASAQPLFAQKKAPVIPLNNQNIKNNNKKPKVKVIPRRIVKAKVKSKAAAPIPKQIDPSIQKDVKQLILPPGMRRMGPGAAPDELKNLAKLKLAPPMKRLGLEEGSSFPPIGAEALDGIGDRIHDIAFGQAANEIRDIGDIAGLADLIGGIADGPMFDFGLGGEDGAGFSDLEDLVAGFGGTRDDGLPDNAPPSGFGFGGIASYEDAVVTKDAETGTVTKTWSWSGADSLGHFATTDVRSTSSRNGSTSLFVTTRYSDSFSQETSTIDADGSAESLLIIRSGNVGTGSSYRRDSDGNFTESHGFIGSDGLVDWSRAAPTHRDTAPQWMRKLSSNPGDDGTTEGQRALANWLWRQHKLGRHSPGGSGPRTTTLVNPGDPDYEGAYIGYPSIGAGFTYRIAVNPDPNMMSGGRRIPSAKAWRLMQQDLKNGVGPGPSPGPDGRGDR